MVQNTIDMVLEHYNPVIESSDALQLAGISVRNLTVDLARTEPNMYAFALRQTR